METVARAFGVDIHYDLENAREVVQEAQREAAERAMDDIDDYRGAHDDREYEGAESPLADVDALFERFA